MKKKLALISVISIIGLTTLGFMLLSNTTTAEIPSASSYAPTFKDWTIHFSEEMDPDTFTNKTVSVTDAKNEHLSASFEWNDSNTILTVKPPENGYTIDQTYLITISRDVQTVSGKKLSDSFKHTFTAVASGLPGIKDENQLMTLLKERAERARSQLFSAEMTTMEMSDESSDMGADGEQASASETNVQVNGIDEGDIIKNDGSFIYFARDTDIVIATSDKDKSKVVSKIDEKDFHPIELYIHDDYLVSIGHTYQSIREKPTKEDEFAETTIYPNHHNQTTAFFYNISDRSNPQKIREVTIEGSFTASRKSDDYIYLVANEQPPFHIMEEMDVDMEARPFVKDTAVSDTGAPVSFDRMYFFPESDDSSFMLLTSINLNKLDEEAKTESYLGASNQLYMSEDHIYLAVNKYDDEKTNTDGEADIMIARTASYTEITQFSIDNGLITYQASTEVDGTLINQFAMDERNNVFRVATTKGNMWQDDEPSTNNLFTFDMDLNPLGSVEGLAEGERIYSIRFMEDVAYMVTFKQVDPLFVIDLKDASNPVVLGELKIPGFSNYLHPLDDTHVIGFGQDTKLIENAQGTEPQVLMNGLKISLFDVSDPANPMEKYSETIGQGGSYSELNHNHKSLYKHPDENLFGFPATLYETKTVQREDITYQEEKFLYEGALLYEITPEDGIKIKDTITHQSEGSEYPEWDSQIKRIVSVDDTLYTFSNNQFKVYTIKDKNIMKTIPLPELIY
ncbi:beta-propeller domain-containing protein [Virgibacillus sp. C22-A2]|uniref:Beta-propeller domain-containing protein n=1 Tax=Virgibacillus tibetensis TaxID=3042313 RepID=A0ABU6KFJ7_9BACI|nr:beta-propeller domain-containing protein [Virgibacillus sp. C22-A2]